MKRIQEIEEALCGAGGYFEAEREIVLGEKLLVFKNRAASLRALVEASAGFGQREYIVYNERRITYEQHYKSVLSVARALEERFDVKKGDRVAILAANNPEWIITFWAAVSIGAIVSCLNGWWVADEIMYGLEDSRPKVLIGDEKRLDRIKGIDVPVPVVTIEKDFEELEKYETDGKLPDVTINEDDPACILYTSGTTGRPKGAVNSHRNIIALVGLQIFSAIRLMQFRELEPAEVPASLVTSPLFHVSGLFGGAAIALATGIKTVWMEGRFDPVKAMRLIQDEGITGWGPMGTIAHRFVNHPDTVNYDLSSLTTIGSGGAPMSKELQDGIRRVFPNASDSLSLGYGSTECTALATINFGEEFKLKPLSSGRPLPTVALEIRDIHGNPVGTGVDGEIFTRSPLVMLEYWKRPEETEETIFPGRWLATGDIGKLDKDGHLIINSRARDLILRGSENIYPVEIEHRLSAHPQVAEAAVLGVDHKELGQEVKAVVVPMQGETIEIEDLVSWVAEALAYFKVPAHWEIRQSSLPKNAVGKVMKHLLDGKESNPFAEE